MLRPVQQLLHVDLLTPYYTYLQTNEEVYFWYVNLFLTKICIWEWFTINFSVDKNWYCIGIGIVLVFLIYVAVFYWYWYWWRKASIVHLYSRRKLLFTVMFIMICCCYHLSRCSNICILLHHNDLTDPNYRIYNIDFVDKPK